MDTEQARQVRPLRGGRKRQNMSLQEEREFLALFLKYAAGGGVLVVGQIKAALVSAYNLLHRYNWRKLVPNKRHPQSDPMAQDEWKKSPPKRSLKSVKTGGKIKSSS
jgi:Winged helix-turn helix